MLEGLLDRERAFWRKHCGVAGESWAPRERALERCLAALTLRGGAERREGLDDWLPELAGPNEEAFRRLLEDHYDGSESRWRDPMQPDLVGEHLVWTACRGGRNATGRQPGAEFIELALADPNAPWSTAFTLLARAEPDHPEDIGRWLEALLNANAQGRAQAAMEGAIAAGSRTAYSTLGLKIAATLNGSKDVALARAISRNLPERSVSLVEVAIWSEQVVLRHGELDNAERARSTAVLGSRLSDVGDRDGALQATREAIDIRRKLASSRPDAFLPDLAMNLGALERRAHGVDRRLDRDVEPAEVVVLEVQLDLLPDLLVVRAVRVEPEERGRPARARSDPTW